MSFCVFNSKIPKTCLSCAHYVKTFNGTSTFGQLWDAVQALGLPLGKKLMMTVGQKANFKGQKC